MQFGFRLAILAGLVFSLISIASAAGPAVSEKLKAVSGQPTDVATSSSGAITIVVGSQPSKGGLRIVPSDQPQTSKLVYTADATSEPSIDHFVYAKGEEQHSVDVTIDAVGGFTAASYAASFKALFVLFVLSVILESALALVFNWRPFVENFNARAVRPLVSFLVALIFVSIYDLDIATKLMNVLQSSEFRNQVPGYIITAMVLGGGSAAINTIFVALGMREIKTPETVQKVPPDAAFISVRAIRKNGSKEPVQIYLLEGQNPTAADAKLVAILRGNSPSGLYAYFLADKSRFPNYGGYRIDKDQVISIEMRKQSGDLLAKWPSTKVAAGAFLDIVLEE